MKEPLKINRRNFVKSSLAVSAFNLLPSSAWANSPNKKLNIAIIGAGGKGSSTGGSIASHKQVNVIAIADVDPVRARNMIGKHKDATFFHDYREMYEKLGDEIDGVAVSTPDHTHYPASIEAVKLKKHIFCEKPLTHDIWQARDIRLSATKQGIVSQMGIQLHSSLSQRMTIEYIQSGIIGKISKVYVWSNKNWGSDDIPKPKGGLVPENLKWDLWLGTGDKRPYIKGAYHPAQWRRLIDFGNGTIGDMGIHIVDTPYAALKLKQPTAVKAQCRESNGITYPTHSIVKYTFENTPYTTSDFELEWRDGKDAPPVIEELSKYPEAKDLKLSGQGCLYVGEEGLLYMPHGGGPRTFPRKLIQSIPKPDLAPRNHYHEWVDCILENKTPSASFNYAGPLSEALLLGCLSLHYPNKTLQWDSKNLKIPNMPEAEKWVRQKYNTYF